MHIFLYKAARHSTDRYGYRNRYKQNTRRGDFNLPLLKKGIGGRYEILVHSEYPFQKELEKMDLQEELYGHIISIKEAKNAVWLKLNYDSVGTASTTYAGSWRDLDPEAIQDNIETFTALKAEHSSFTSLCHTIRYQLSRTNDFISNLSRMNQYDLTEINAVSSDYRLKLEEEYSKAFRKCEVIRAKMVDEQQKVKDYMTSRKF